MKISGSNTSVTTNGHNYFIEATSLTVEDGASLTTHGSLYNIAVSDFTITGPNTSVTTDGSYVFTANSSLTVEDGASLAINGSVDLNAPNRNFSPDAKVSGDRFTNYAVTVHGGTALPTNPVDGQTVQITADAPDPGKVFHKWMVDSSNVTLADENEATTSSPCPARMWK